MAELSAVLHQLKQERARVTAQLQQLNNAIQALSKAAGNSGPGGRVKRTLSLAARKKIAAAQRLRWERVRAKAAKKAAA